MIITKKSTQDVIVSDLARNNFSRTKSLATAVRVLPYEERDLERLIEGRDPEWETVLRSKFDGSNRPGCHLSLRAQAEYAALFEPLEEAYWQHAAEFDHNRVYSLVLKDPATRMARPDTFTDTSADHALWRKHSVLKATNAGGWVAGVDLSNFYRDITVNHVLDELGVWGLCLDPRLVDAISTFVGRFGPGLPQGSIVSDLIARLILTALDRELRDRGVDCDRYVDDYHVYGATEIEVQKRASTVIHHIAKRKFDHNREKVWHHGPSRLHWLGKGVNWGPVMAERYEREPDYEYDCDLDEEKFSGSIGWPAGDFDHEALFLDEYATHGRFRSEHGMRFNYRHVGAVCPHTVVPHVRWIVSRHSSTIPYLVSGFEERRAEVASIAFNAIPERASMEDDRLVAIESCPDRNGHEMATAWLTCLDGIESRAIRQGAYEALLPTTDALVIASSTLPGVAWSDEIASVLHLSLRVGGRVARVTQNLICNQYPTAGIVLDALESAA